MHATRRTTTRSNIGDLFAHLAPPVAMLAIGMLLAAGAQAQTPACEQLKATLSARISPEIRGYSMEGVPADAPVPAGARAIGTCGAYKILYRRFGGGSPTSPAGASAPDPAPSVTAAPDEPSKRAPVAPVDRAVRPAPASAPNPTPRTVARAPEPAPTPAAPPPEPQKAAAASDVVVARATEPAPAKLDEAPLVKDMAPPDAPTFWAENWPWIAALLLLPLGGWAWAWFAHRRAYDQAGLPRGPRL